MLLLKHQTIAVIFCIAAFQVNAQKQLKLDDDLKQNAIVFEPKMQGKQTTVEMTEFTFGDHKVINLRNNWERNRFWSIFLKERNIRRVTVVNRTGYSFQLLENAGNDSTGRKKDTANVAILFEKTTPEGFLITSGSSIEKMKLGPEVTTAFIQSTKGNTKWQVAMYDTPKKFLSTEWTVTVFADNYTINSSSINQLDNGKKPIVTGVKGLGSGFYRDGKQIAAIQYPGFVSPRIWISNKLDEEEKLLMAALMEALLIMSSDQTQKQYEVGR